MYESIDFIFHYSTISVCLLDVFFFLLFSARLTQKLKGDMKISVFANNYLREPPGKYMVQLVCQSNSSTNTLAYRIHVHSLVYKSIR